MGIIHEQYTDFDTKGGPSNKNFGLTLACACTIISALGKFKYDFSLKTICVFSCLAAALLLTTLIKADSLKSLNHYWTMLGKILHKVTTPIIMFVIYILVFIPIGLIIKLSGKNTMFVYQDGTNSFWINKAKTELADPMKYQF